MRKRWMPRDTFRQMVEQDATWTEIRAENERLTGWPPSRSAISRHRKKLALGSVRGSRRNLIPWILAEEHRDDPFRHMLQAVGRSREPDVVLSNTDRKWIDLLEDYLHGRIEMVVGYSRQRGFHLLRRLDTDQDIIRVYPDDDVIDGYWDAA